MPKEQGRTPEVDDEEPRRAKAKSHRRSRRRSRTRSRSGDQGTGPGEHGIIVLPKEKVDPSQRRSDAVGAGNAGAAPELAKLCPVWVKQLLRV
mgnify:FL=1